MLTRSIVRVALSLAIFVPALNFALPVRPAAASTAQRRQVSLLPTQDTPLNQALIQAFKQKYADFDFLLLNYSLSSPPGPFLAEFKRWQKEHAGELPLLQDSSLVRVAEAELPGLDVRRLAQTSLALVPAWTMSPLALTGPHRRQQEDGTEYWSIDVESVLGLSLSVFRTAGDYAQMAGAQTQSWTIHKEIPIPDMERLLALVNQATGVAVDLDNPAQASLVLDTLKRVQPFRDIPQAEPVDYLQSELVQQMNPVQFESLLVALQSVEELGGKKPETATVAAFSGLGLTPVLKVGTTSLGMLGFVPQYFVPQGQLELQYDVGAMFGLPDFLLTLSGGATLPQSAYLLLAQPSFPGLGIPGGGLPNPSAQLLAYNAELGIMKRFAFGQWRFNLGVRGGLLGGLLMQATSPFPNPLQPDPSAMAFGGTALVGAAYQFTPQFSVGLDAGFRYFDGGQWIMNTGGFPQPFQPLYQNPLQSIGPDLAFYAGYTF